jgi:hypothetical protein
MFSKMNPEFDPLGSDLRAYRDYTENKPALVMVFRNDHGPQGR